MLTRPAPQGSPGALLWVGGTPPSWGRAPSTAQWLSSSPHEIGPQGIRAQQTRCSPPPSGCGVGVGSQGQARAPAQHEEGWSGRRNGSRGRLCGRRRPGPSRTLGGWGRPCNSVFRLLPKTRASAGTRGARRGCGGHGRDAGGTAGTRGTRRAMAAAHGPRCWALQSICCKNRDSTENETWFLVGGDGDLTL